MPVRVIIPPAPILTPEEISGVEAGDTFVAAMIAAVTGEIDGPVGWLGRCLGEQTLELSLSCWPNSCQEVRLPCPPLIEVESVSYIGEDGAEHTLASGQWRERHGLLWFPETGGFLLANEPYPIRVRYRAGYDGESVKDGGTGNVPAQVKQALILSVQHLRSLAKDDLFVRAKEVDGIGRTEYTVSEQAGNIIRQASDRLLSGLRVYA